MEGFAKVGTISDLAAEAMQVVRTPGGRRLLIKVEDSFYAVDTRCTHQGCALVDGKLEGTTLTCPCHFARFDVTTGALQSGPRIGPLPVYEVRMIDNEVWVAA